jgi:hypothetical protein
LKYNFNNNKRVNMGDLKYKQKRNERMWTNNSLL